MQSQGKAMSPIQKFIWQWQEIRDQTLFNFVLIEFRGKLNTSKFKEYIQEVLQAHELLSCSFHFNELYKKPTLSYNQESIELKVRELNLTSLSNEDQNSKIYEILSEKSAHEGHDHLFFETIIIAKDEAVYDVIFGLPSIVSDSRSLQILGTHVFSLYVNGKADFLPVGRIEHSEFSEWHLSLVQNPEEEARTHWRNYYNDRAQNSSAFSFAKGSSSSSRKTTFKSIEITGDHMSKLMKLNDTGGFGADNSLLTSLFILLFLHTRSRKVMIGYSSNERGLDELKGTVGPLDSSLPISIGLQSENSFGQVLEKVKNAKEKLKTYKEYCDLEKISPNKINFEYIDLKSLSHHDNKQWSFSNFCTNLGMFGLAISCIEFSDSIKINFFSDQRYYSNEALELVVEQFIRVLNLSIENTNMSISQGLIASNGEKTKILNVFNKEILTLPNDCTLDQILSKTIIKNYSRKGVSTLGSYLSYSELDRKSGILAQIIRDEYGIGYGDIVAVTVDRNEWIIITLIAIIKAGAAFLPIDPSTPVKRRSFFIDDSGAKLVIDSHSNQSLLTTSNTPSYKIDISDQIWNRKYDSIYSHFEPRKLDSLLYIIYTSGSTGIPKGVSVSDRSLINYVNWFVDHFSITSEDSSVLLSSYAFDLGFTSIWGSLFAGGTLHILAENYLSDTKMLIEFLISKQITFLKTTPSLFNTIINYPNEKILRNCLSILRLIVLGGEKVNYFDVSKAHHLGKDLRCVNHYGPTEFTIGALFSEIDNSSTKEHGKSVIGKPIKNNGVIILDSDQNLASIGTIGEICLYGLGVSNGYVNDKELTDAKFIQNPYDSLQKIYRTGDLGRFLENGDVEFLGRQDSQLKLNGFRIELEEIRAESVKFKGVENAYIFIKENSEAQALFSALVSRQELDVEELIRHLKKSLPEYMVPQFFLVLDELPLTANGKVDEVRLKEAFDLKLNKIDYVAPRNSTEHLLSKVFQDVLSIEEVGIYDDFFSLGGDSIRAIRAISSINNGMGSRLQIKDIYNNSDVISLANFLEGVHSPTSSNKLRNSIRRELDQLKHSILEKAEYSKLIPGNFEDIYPMSDVESGMLYHTLRETKVDVFIDIDFRIIPDQDFKIEAFDTAIRRLIQKHEILRSRFYLSSFDKPMKIILKSLGSMKAFEFDDLTDIPKGDQREYISGALLQESKVLRNLIHEDGHLLWKLKIFKLEPNSFSLVWIRHHALMDGWSTSSFLTELNNVYLKTKASSQFNPENLKITHKDSLIESLVNKNEKRALAFWQKEIEDFHRFAITSEEDDLKSIHQGYSKHYLKKLEEFTTIHKVSLKSIFLGAHLYALSCWSYSKDLTVGLVSNVRPTSEDGDKLIGCFLNIIPFRFQYPVHQKLSLLGYIKLVQSKLDELKNYDRITLAELSQISGQDGKSSNPFFDILFDFVDFHIIEEMIPIDDSGDINKELNDIEINEHANTYLDVVLNKTGGQLEIKYASRKMLLYGLSLELLNELFGAFVSKMLNNPEHLLRQGILFEDNTSFGEIALFQKRQKKLLSEFNDTNLELSNHKTVLSLFEEQVSKFSENTAVTFYDESISYEELNVLSNQLAHHLRNDQNLKKGDIVGIMMSRSIETVICILAIMKSGGIYVPIDPSHPPRRRIFIIEDSRPKILLTTVSNISDMGHAGDFGALKGEMVLVLADELITKFSTNKKPLNVDIKPEDPAYIIYTSGSTGQPKGVIISHGSIVNLSVAQINKFGISSTDCVLQFASLSFDASISEVFMSINSGAKMAIIDVEDTKDSKRLVAYLNKNAVTVATLPPSYLSSLSIEDLSSLRVVISAGEPADVGVAVKCSKYFECYNAYGPTECTVCVSIYQASPKDRGKSNLPIGKLIPNTRAYVLDSTNELVPVGVPGELCIASAGLAIGYLNNDNATKENFIDNPFQDEGYERLYKTGDLASWLPDGNLEFLGRLDDQVKIRGYRIELGEIMTCLNNHPEISQSLVLSQGIGHSKYLVAYYAATSVVSVAALERYLLDHLPKYMLPAHFVPLESFPLTHSGKINKNKLPNPVDSLNLDGIGPKSEIEQKLVKIWSRVLEMDEKLISTTKDFFELGGSSLSVIRVLSLLENDFAISISVSSFFEKSSITEIGKLIHLENSSDKNQTGSEVFEL